MSYGTFLRLSSVDRAEEEFGKLRAVGFDCCHLVYKPETYTKEDADIVRAAADSNGVEISALFAGFRDNYTKWNLYSDFKDAGINSKAYGEERIAYLKQAAEFCRLAGIENMLIHAGFVANDPFSDDYLLMLGLVKELAEFMKEKGVDLLLETGGESPVTLRRLIEDAAEGNIFANLDTANLIMYGFGNPVDAVVTLHPYIRSVHIKDGLPPEDPKELGKETEFGEGHADFPRIFNLLNRYGFDGPYIIEREISDEKAAEKIAQTLAKVRSMLAE